MKPILPESRNQGWEQEKRPAGSRPAKNGNGAPSRAGRPNGYGEGTNTNRNAHRDARGNQSPASRGDRPHRKRSTINSSSLIVFGVIVLLIFILIPTALTLRATGKQLDEAKAIESSLEAQRQDLQASVDELNSQLKIVNTNEFISKVAHEKLGMIHPNEILMQVEDGGVQLDEKALSEWESAHPQGIPVSESSSEAAPSESAPAEGASQSYGASAPPVEEAPQESSSNNAE